MTQSSLVFSEPNLPVAWPCFHCRNQKHGYLCALKQSRYQHCEKLEDAPGNDNSPNSLKKQIENLIGHEPNAKEQAEWVKSGKIDPGRIDMPSYNAFRKVLDSALDEL